jgi:hypothetical protein
MSTVTGKAKVFSLGHLKVAPVDRKTLTIAESPQVSE